MNKLLDAQVVKSRLEFKSVSLEDFRAALTTLMTETKSEHEGEMQNPVYNYALLFDKEYSKAEHLGKVWQHLSHLKSVADTPDLRTLYNEFLPQIQELFFDMYQLDERPFEILKNYRKTSDYKALTGIRKKLVDRQYDEAVISGAELPTDKKQQLKNIVEEMSALQNKFSQNIMDDKKTRSLTLTKDELTGVPERIMSKALSLSGGTDYLFTMVDGNLPEILNWCEVDSTKQKAYNLMLSLADNPTYDNRSIARRIVELRQEKAQLLGFDNYAQLSLHDKMVKDPAKVTSFLDNLGYKTIAPALDEQNALQLFAHETLGKATIEFWDKAYVTQKFKEAQYSYNEEIVQEYLHLPKILEGLYSKTKELFGVEFVLNEDAANCQWHPDVQFYHVMKGNAKIGDLALDLYKREGKRDGAWMSPVAAHHIYDSGRKDLPMAYVVCNYVKAEAGKPQTIDFDDLTTLFHEFGHATHQLLSRVEKSTFSGTNVEWDAVELPSQFLENFCWDYSLIEKMSEGLPYDLFEKMLAAKNFMAASMNIRQVVLSELDMKIYMQPGADPIEVEDITRHKWKISEFNETNYMVPSFSHIMTGGYAAGYYGYKWAEVLSADAFAAVKESPELIEKYCVEILEVGGSRDMLDSFVAFRGREPKEDFLLIDLGIQKPVKTHSRSV